MVHAGTWAGSPSTTRTRTATGSSSGATGEWLTKIAVGYGGEFGDDDPIDDWYYNDSAHQNTLAIENEEPIHSWIRPTTGPSCILRGSQWEYGGDGDPTILALSVRPGYVYALGDATDLLRLDLHGVDGRACMPAGPSCGSLRTPS